MKRTDLEKREREIKRSQKKVEVLQRREGAGERKPGMFIDALCEKFFCDAERIYNIEDSVEILEILEDIKACVDEDKQEAVIRKAVKKSGVKEKEEAVQKLVTLGDFSFS